MNNVLLAVDGLPQHFGGLHRGGGTLNSTIQSKTKPVKGLLGALFIRFSSPVNSCVTSNEEQVQVNQAQYATLCMGFVS